MACPMMHDGGDEGATGSRVSILGFETTSENFLPPLSPGAQSRKLSNYGDYIATTQLLQLQDGITPTKRKGETLVHHEEMTFIIVHQAFELWFKLVLADLKEVKLMITDLWKHPVSLHQRLAMSLSYLQRCEKIFTHTNGSWDILETMHPADFLEFRDYLVPASGFQSSQFRELEILLGLQDSRRYRVNGRPVWTYLSEEQQKKLTALLDQPSINEILISVLHNVQVPDTFLPMFLERALRLARERQYVFAKCKPGDPHAEAQIAAHVQEITNILENPAEHTGEGAQYENQSLRKALIAALYLTSYRHVPQCTLIVQLMDHLIALEEGILLWRSRHLHAVERIIGRRVGTGGSSGVEYLEHTRRYRIFDVLWILRKVFLRSTILVPFEELHAGKDLKDIHIFAIQQEVFPPAKPAEVHYEQPFGLTESFSPADAHPSNF